MKLRDYFTLRREKIEDKGIHLTYFMQERQKDQLFHIVTNRKL